MKKLLNHIKMLIVLRKMRKDYPNNYMIQNAKIVDSKLGRERDTSFYKTLTSKIELLEESLYKEQVDPEEAVQLLENFKSLTESDFTRLLDIDYSKEDSGREMEVNDLCLRIAYVMDAIPMFGKSDNEFNFISNIKKLPEYKEPTIDVMSEEEINNLLV